MTDSPGAVVTANSTDCPILISSEARLPLPAQLGAAHYSYRLTEGKFVRLLQTMGYRPEPVPLPPFHGLRRPANGNVPGRAPIHLIFRSTENIRLIAGCYNISCFAWEFDVLKNDTLSFEHPFANQRRMLNACDEVWVASGHAAAVLQAHGVANVHRVPAPEDPQPRLVAPEQRPASLAKLRGTAAVQLKISNMVRFETRGAVVSLVGNPEIANAMAARKLFLAVLNPHDKRKNLHELLLGFAIAAASHPDAALLVKLVLPPRAQANAVLLSDILPRFERPISLRCDRILFLPAFLSDEQLSALYDIADFYLCASVAEGQNLPVIEAMAHGVVPVSAIHTAMLDYLNDDNCVAIRTRKFAAFERRTAADLVHRPYAVEFCSQTDIGRAVLRACTLPRARVEAMRRRALRTVHDAFSTPAVSALVRERFAAIHAAGGLPAAVIL
jgi:glycosyltransferase involved in cell wall biosynthesis